MAQLNDAGKLAWRPENVLYSLFDGIVAASQFCVASGI